MVANQAHSFEELMQDCWPAMFEATSNDDIRWLHSVADLLEHRARERDESPDEDDAEEELDHDGDEDDEDDDEDEDKD